MDSARWYCPEHGTVAVADGGTSRSCPECGSGLRFELRQGGEPGEPDDSVV